MAVLIGLSIWKLLQLARLSGLFGGYLLARNIHLAIMFCIIVFLALHLLLVAIYPRTLVSVLAALGRRKSNDPPPSHPRFCQPFGDLTGGRQTEPAQVIAQWSVAR